MARAHNRQCQICRTEDAETTNKLLIGYICFCCIYTIFSFTAAYLETKHIRRIVESMKHILK